MATCFAAQDDNTLARLAQAGELSAFDELARRYQSPLLRFVRRRSPADAEDIVQETLVAAYERLAQFQLGRSFKSWLFAIAYHESIDHARRRRVRAAEQAADIAVHADPAEIAAVADRNESLWAAAKQMLTDEQFAAVWLFYVEQLPTREIARMQRRSWVSVKVMLHRARSTLARKLESAGYSEFATPALEVHHE